MKALDIDYGLLINYFISKAKFCKSPRAFYEPNHDQLARSLKSYKSDRNGKAERSNRKALQALFKIRIGLRKAQAQGKSLKAQQSGPVRALQPKLTREKSLK